MSEVQQEDIRFQVTMAPELHQKLMHWASEHGGLDRSAAIRFIVTEWLRQQGERC